MDPATAIALVSLLVSLAVTGVQLGTAKANSKARKTVNSIITTIRDEIGARRLKLSKILSLLLSNNNSALTTYLTQNPVVASRLKDLTADSDAIALLQSEQQNLEAKIDELKSQINQYGYDAIVWDEKTDIDDPLQERKEEYDRLQSEYDDLIARAEAVKPKATNYSKPVTSDIDARSQNVQGGMK